MLLSRSSSAVYWMSRYLERADNIARFLNVNRQILLDRPDIGNNWATFIRMTGDSEEFVKRYENLDEKSALQFLVCDSTYTNSVRSCIQQARHNAAQIRDVITAEMWELINRSFLFMQEFASFPLAEATAFFNELNQLLQQYRGAMESGLSRDEVWHFHRLGQMIERADKTSRILDGHHQLLKESPKQESSILWSGLLKSVDALHMYRKSCRLIQSERVARFMLLDTDFPRSVAHCIIQAEVSLLTIVKHQAGAHHLQCMRQIRALRAWLHAEAASDFLDKNLHEAIDELQILLNSLGDALHSELLDGQQKEACEIHDETVDDPSNVSNLEDDWDDAEWNVRDGFAQ